MQIYSTANSGDRPGDAYGFYNDFPQPLTAVQVLMHKDETKIRTKKDYKGGVLVMC